MLKHKKTDKLCNQNVLNVESQDLEKNKKQNDYQVIWELKHR